MPLLNHPANFPPMHYFDVEELQASATELVGAREHFLDAVRSPVEPAGDQTELAAAELLRQAVTVGRELRQGLSALMVAYAALWARAHRPGTVDDIDDFDDIDDIDDFDDFDDTDVRLQALDKLSEKLELLIAEAGQTTEGRSPDGRIKVTVDDRMRLIELDLDSDLLDDPAYKASVVEAINDGIGPVARRRLSMAEALLPEPEPLPETPEVTDDIRAKGAAMGVFDALCGLEEVQLRLAELLPRISRGEDRRQLVDQVDLIEEICADYEEQLRDHLPSVDSYHTLLPAKARLHDVTTDDLAGLESVAELFVEMDVARHFDSETLLGGRRNLRALVATVAEELQRQDAERRSQLHWQRKAQLIRARIAEVIEQTFEGRSGDGLITARASGAVQLVDLQLESDHRAAPDDIKAAVIDAVNAALAEAAHRRSVVMMIESG